MARIRSIKPEFWESETTGKLTPLGALTFIGLISLADDEGRGRAGSVQLHGRLHAARMSGKRQPVSHADTLHALRELVDAGLIELYSDEKGSSFYYIRGFTEHQKIDRPGKSKLPIPPSLANPRDNSRALVEDSSTDQGSRIKDQGEEQIPALSHSQIAKEAPGTSQESVLVTHWNDQKDRAPIGLQKGVRWIHVAVAAGVKLADIQAAFWDSGRCKGKTILAVLDELKARASPKTDPGYRVDGLPDWAKQERGNE